jgi:hypothetical protein
LYIGKSRQWFAPNFEGQMRDLFIWDVALDETQLEAIRTSGIPPTDIAAPLVEEMRTVCPSPGSTEPTPTLTSTLKRAFRKLRKHSLIALQPDARDGGAVDSAPSSSHASLAKWTTTTNNNSNNNNNQRSVSAAGAPTEELDLAVPTGVNEGNYARESQALQPDANDGDPFLMPLD